jgi:dihydrolipoamide dehydrogenase
MTRVVIIGGGPGGYEAALVARQDGAEVFIIERDGLGGSAVLTDVVPSKGLISVGEVLTRFHESVNLGITSTSQATADLAAINERLKKMATTQSRDIGHRLDRDGITVIHGSARLLNDHQVEVSVATAVEILDADVILIATGARPRIIPTAAPDGERIFTWEKLYDLEVLPEHLIVVGSGVTGAEFASAYHALGSEVTLVSSRDRVLPGEDSDAANVIENVFVRRGINVVNGARAAAVRNTGQAVEVELADGRTIVGSHCLMAVGSLPNVEELGLAEAGVELNTQGFIEVDRVSRTSARGVYAAGDCTGVLMLASTAAMQGRIAMRHALGGAVAPLDLDTVAANVFTDPEIATVGVTQAQVDAKEVEADSVLLALNTNPRAKMQELHDGFVKLFCVPSTRTVIGGVVVAPRASELIFSISLAVTHKLTVDDVAATFTVYPSLSGSIAEAARRLHTND